MSENEEKIDYSEENENENMTYENENENMTDNNKNKNPFNLFDANTKIYDIISNLLLGPLENGERNPKWSNQLILALVIIICCSLVFELLRFLITRYISYIRGSPWLVPYMKRAQRDLLITQDPNIRTSIPLRRSLNESQGIEFSYSLWMLIDDITYKQGILKNVFLKGTYDFTSGTMCPGLFINSNTNSLLLYINTYSEPYVVKEIENIPLNKWFHIAIVLKNQNVDIFINGLLKSRMTLNSLPRQNFSDLYINKNGGYSGYLSRMRYHNYALSYAEIEAEVTRGPSTYLQEESASMPPYLSSSWFLN